jgi:hypothetical protein
MDAFPSPRRSFVSAAALLLACSASACTEPLRSGDRAREAPPVEVVPERLGNVFAQASAYARNVWDMQLFGGLIWLGHGDSIDNWGPIPIWSLDPGTGALTREFTADDEQVDEFRVLGGELYVPGHDGRGDWTMGEFYRLESGGWMEHRTIPHGLHVFDLALHGGRLFAALGTEDVRGQETVVASADRGESWTAVTDETDRVYDLFELSGVLYGAPKMNAGDSTGAWPLLRFDGARFVRTQIGGATLLAGIPGAGWGRMVRPTEFGGVLIYIAAGGTFDWIPVSLAVTRDLREVRRAALPDAAAVPYDLLVRGGTLYVLAAAPDGARGGYTMRVYRSADTLAWRELFHFHAATFARSFEESGGDFFFGLGCDYPAPHPASGDLLRVSRGSYGG